MQIHMLLVPQINLAQVLNITLNNLISVYLRAPPEVCYNRIKMRNRKEEAGVPFVSHDFTHWSLRCNWLCPRLFLGWVGLWGLLWWAPSAKRKDHHKVSSGWSSVWHRTNTGLSSTQYEQIPIILGVWPFWLTPFFFSVNNILAGLWLNCVSSVEITLFLLADIIAA